MNIYHPEYRQELSQSNYPFVPEASLKSTAISLPAGLIVDAHLYPITGDGRYYLSRIEADNETINFIIGDLRFDNVAKGTIVRNNLKDVVALTSTGGTSAGLILLNPEKLPAIAGISAGVYNFGLRQAEFCLNCTVPVSNTGVSGILLPNGEVVSGHVWLYGEDGVVLTAFPDTGKVLINIIGDPLAGQDLCEGQVSPVPIKRINVKHDSGQYYCNVRGGEFKIQISNQEVLDPVLRVTSESQGTYIWMAGVR